LELKKELENKQKDQQFLVAECTAVERQFNESQKILTDIANCCFDIDVMNYMSICPSSSDHFVLPKDDAIVLNISKLNALKSAQYDLYSQLPNFIRAQCYSSFLPLSNQTNSIMDNYSKMGELPVNVSFAACTASLDDRNLDHVDVQAMQHKPDEFEDIDVEEGLSACSETALVDFPDDDSSCKTCPNCDGTSVVNVSHHSDMNNSVSVLNVLCRQEMYQMIRESQLQTTMVQNQSRQFQVALDQSLQVVSQLRQQLANSDLKYQLEHEKFEKIADEFKSAKENYESMITQLTEHICQLTEKIAMLDGRGRKQNR
jgi:hypothetical protein